jgi:hypothetical protein
MRSSVIQSVLFDKKKWDLVMSIQWLRKHKFDTIKVDETMRYIRWRQVEPLDLKYSGYGDPHTKSIGDGIKLIIYYLNE